ncbi:uncharacterized protein LOC124642343 [Helicoverpa zea]|uniref:uncharacterized protein LOC124642343 n=1 Tax=Helicoverpa zea TaxID=7113 RepID=UPI001F570B77|nr:uncharacterized protein LOC124642343 [Helicoverpa zea]
MVNTYSLAMAKRNINYLQFFYQNVRGLRTKTNIFYENILSSESDILMFTETWLHDGISDSELCNDVYDLFIRRDRGSLGGGVMIACASRLQARARTEWDRPDLECIWITVPARVLGVSRNLHVATVYLPPDRALPVRIELLSQIITEVIDQNPNDYLLISGDFNLPGVEWTSGHPVLLKRGAVEIQNSASHLINTTRCCGLNQYNFLTNSHNHTLDLIFANFSNTTMRSSCPLVPEDTFHPAIVVQAVDILIPPLKLKSFQKHFFGRGNYERINSELLEYDWGLVCDSGSGLDRVIEMFYSVINSVIDKYVPKSTVGGAYSYPVWYSRALINVIKEKSKAHRLWKKYSNPHDYATFALLRDRQKKMQKECHKSFINRSQENIKNSPKQFWAYVKARKKNKNSYPKYMTYDTNLLTSETEICNCF